MFKILLLAIIAGTADSQQNDPAANQLPDFKNKTSGPIRIISSSGGAPVGYKDATSSLNRNLLSNENLMDVISHLTRERIPERVAHAKGAGAFGFFETTHDISYICKAKIFSSIGKKTPIAVRFSLGSSDKGGVETLADIRGFAVRFYSEDGNFDILGINTPIFTIKDPLYFRDFLHIVKRNPTTNLRDDNALWDFLTLRPESLFAFLFVLGDRGIPDGYRHMPGYSVQTYEVYNENGVKSYVRFHFSPYDGLKNLNRTEAAKIAGEDQDYATRDLYNAIKNGNNPSWLVSMQILSEEDKQNADFDIFDVTRRLPENQYPLYAVGRLVLNKNPVNYFAEIEQLAFRPSNLVPGVLGSPDHMFELRRLAYRDTQNYRLGGNVDNIPVNCPLHKVFNYNRDGVPPVKRNGRDAPNYYPNSFNGPVPYFDKNQPLLSQIFEKESYNFDQASDYYLNELTPKEQGRLIENIVNSLCPVANVLKERAMSTFYIINYDLGKKVAIGLASKTTKCSNS